MSCLSRRCSCGATAALIVISGACARNHRAPSLAYRQSPTMLDSGDGAAHGARAIPIDKRGCRAPAEEGCAECCAQLGSECEIRIEDPRVDDYAALGYRSSDRFAAPCPEGCAPCAQCSRHDQIELETRRAAKPECHCSKPLSEDPCFYDSCDCFCESLVQLTSRCPSSADSN